MPRSQIAFVNCGRGGDSSNGNGQADARAVVTEVDAFNPPSGDLVQGVTALEGWEPLRLLPAPVNIDGGWTDSVTVNSKGNCVYFAYSKVDFSKRYYSQVTEFSGPLRTGMVGDEFRIFYAELTASGWTVKYHPINSSNLDFV